MAQGKKNIMGKLVEEMMKLVEMYISPLWVSISELVIDVCRMMIWEFPEMGVPIAGWFFVNGKTPI